MPHHPKERHRTHTKNQSSSAKGGFHRLWCLLLSVPSLLRQLATTPEPMQFLRVAPICVSQVKSGKWIATASTESKRTSTSVLAVATPWFFPSRGCLLPGDSPTLLVTSAAAYGAFVPCTDQVVSNHEEARAVTETTLGFARAFACRARLAALIDISFLRVHHVDLESDRVM